MIMGICTEMEGDTTNSTQELHQGRRNYMLEYQGRFVHIKATETSTPVLGALSVS